MKLYNIINKKVNEKKVQKIAQEVMEINLDVFVNLYAHFVEERYIADSETGKIMQGTVFMGKDDYLYFINLIF